MKRSTCTNYARNPACSRLARNRYWTLIGHTGRGKGGLSFESRQTSTALPHLPLLLSSFFETQNTCMRPKQRELWICMPVEGWTSRVCEAQWDPASQWVLYPCLAPNPCSAGPAAPCETAHDPSSSSQLVGAQFFDCLIFHRATPGHARSTRTAPWSSPPRRRSINPAGPPRRRPVVRLCPLCGSCDGQTGESCCS